MEQLKKAVQDYRDEELLEQYTRHLDEYTPEAAALLREEIERRNLDPTAVPENAPVERLHLDSNDFVRFEHNFSRTDIQLAATILREHKVIFFIDNPQSSPTIPLESESTLQFTIQVHKEQVEEAHLLLDEHYEKIDGRYQLKKMGVRERLKLFSFHDLHLSEQEAAEQVDVVLTPEEKETIIRLGKRVLEEGDAIEQQQERVIFYYDSIEPLITLLSAKSEASLSRTDLLTILEILQIYCDDPAFPPFMEESARTLLAFFFS